MKKNEARPHEAIYGETRCGKSRLIEWLAMQDIKAGRGVCLVDPHGQTCTNVLDRIAALSIKHPEIVSRLVYIHPRDKKWVVGINPLEKIGSVPPELLSQFFTDISMQVWDIDPNIAARMGWLLVHVLLALAEVGLTIRELPEFLSDEDLRDALVTVSRNKEVQRYFRKEFPPRPVDQIEWAQSTLNKMGRFMMDKDLEMMFGQQKSTVNFRQLMDEQKIVLVNLDKGELGDQNSRLLGAFIVSMFTRAAFTRTHTSPPFRLYLDEWQTYTTMAIEDVLTEAGKYQVFLTLANQYLDQIPSKQLRSAVLGNVGGLIIFRVGYDDAKIFSRYVFDVDVDPVRRRNYKWNSFMTIPYLSSDDEFRPLEAEWERHTQELKNQANREFWMRQRGPFAPVKKRTFDMPDPVVTEEIVKARERLIEISGQRYARLKSEVRRELDEERPRYIESLCESASPPERDE